MTSNNPFFKSKSYDKPQSVHVDEQGNRSVLIDYQETMTVNGTINKSLTMLLLLMATATLTWVMTASGYNPMPFLIGGGVVGFILVLVASFKLQLSGYLAPGYAVFEGLFIGAVSALFEAMYPGIVIQAVGATFTTFLVCFLLYKYKVVTVTEKFKSIVIGATITIAIFYVITWLLSMFTSFQPVHYGNSLMSIGISVIVIVVAALNLFLDFDQIEKGAEKQLPKYMEWFGAMGLMITLVWLYIEFLRLFSKLASRD
ncbi:Bax inhibitor-1/YccA family protein [Flavobacterium sp.]|uniref:Bax inhibitor-1/YccA family protein n=1 Tax=Flavobacterium sp. TaxID=239 RepID=UPI002636BAD4|nr:Bax inhibitor-1/YccA family protein [Flavobacterium sp.]MDD2984817.1 Bax inhibitor-1/YccA family protein [Flavobacterium sp.]